MAVDKLVDSTQLDTDLTSVANAIRTKGGTSASLAFPTGFVDAIDAIETGGGGSETGSFLGSGSRNATISVTSLKSHIRIWLDGVKSDDDLTNAPYGNLTIMEINADNDTGFILLISTYNSGASFLANQDPKIGRWGGNTAWSNRVEFGANSIKIINAAYSGAGALFNGSFTYNWEAW